MKKTGLFILVIMIMLIILFNKQIIKNYKILYKINNYEITEETNYNNEYYYNLEIKKNKITYRITVTKNIYKKKIVKDILEYKEDSLSCIKISFTDTLIDDVIKCNIDEQNMSYYSIYNQYPSLDKYVKNEWNFEFNNQITPNKKDNLLIYENNFLLDETIVVYDYRGINIINKDKISYIELSKKDVYKNELAFILNDYYISPIIDNDYNFNELYIINLKTSKKKIKKLNTNISLSSYLQGINNDFMYLFDVDNKVQYKINQNEVTEVGNKKINAVYFDETLKRENIYNFVSNKLNIFNEEINYTYQNNILNHNGKLYKIEKEENIYTIYRYYDENIKTILFKIDDIKEVQFSGDTIYFISNDKIKKYNDTIGVVDLMQNSEFLFNYRNIFLLYK